METKKSIEKAANMDLNYVKIIEKKCFLPVSGGRLRPSGLQTFVGSNRKTSTLCTQNQSPYAKSTGSMKSFEKFKEKYPLVI